MNIHLPPSLESPILDAVHSGRYATLDDAMAEAAALLIELLKHEKAQAGRSPTLELASLVPQKPIWDEILDLTADVPDEEWDKLPTDLAEQHDHYLYGTPKRPTV